MKWALQPGETPLFGQARGCDEFEQALLRFDGPSEARASDADDELLYVLGGTGVADIGGERAELTPGTSAWVGRATPWQVLEAEGLEILSVLVREPRAGDGTHVVLGV